MKMRIPLMLILLSLSLATNMLATPATTIIYDDGPGSFIGVAPPSIGHSFGLNFATSDTVQCTNICRPTDITFYTRTPVDVPVPTNETVLWNFASGPNFGVGYNSGSSVTPSGLPCATAGGFNLCIVHINLAGTFFQPAFSWLTLRGLTNDVDWAFSPLGTSMAQTCIVNGAGICGPTLGGITPEGFNVSGQVVPEPSSMLLLGSGVLGLAGVLRRKLMR